MPASSTTPLMVVRAWLMAAVATWIAWRHGNPVTVSLATLLVLLALVATFSRETYAPVARCIDTLAGLTAKGFSWCVLAVLFYLVVTPLAFFLRLRRDPPSAAPRWKEETRSSKEFNFEGMS